MSKKKGEKLLAKLAQTASEEVDRVDAGPRKKIKICLDLTAGKLPQPPTPEEILRNLLKSSSQQDRNVEFLKFRKNCPKLLPSVQRELDQLVRSELQVDNVDVDQEQLNRKPGPN